MPINAAKSAIFIHIPKTAGISIAANFKGVFYIGHHASAREASRNMDGLDDWFTFSFVRNPWDNLYSHYKFTCQRDDVNNIPQNYYSEIGFKKWLMQKSYWAEPRNRFCIKPVQQQNQIDWLIGFDNEIAVDFVGRYENLQNDWDIICDKINIKRDKLPHLNKTIRKDDYKVAYDDESREYVSKIFKRDIEAFGYEF